MKPSPFDYVRAESVEHAVALLAQHRDEAKLLAGGQSLVPLLNLRLARPALVIDIARLPLQGIGIIDGQIRLGALVRHRVLEFDETIAAELPLLALCVNLS